jgi:peroxiredoxin family protein
MSTSLAIFLHNHEYDRLYQASSMVLAATSLGWSCHLFLFHQALASFLEGEWDDTDTVGGGESQRQSVWSARLRQGFEASNVPSLHEMLEKARAGEGELTIYACSASVKVLGVDIQGVRQQVDEIVGLPTMLGIAGNATHMLYI